LLCAVVGMGLRVTLALPGNRRGAPVPGRALRGGSWNDNQDDARASARNRNNIDNRNNDIGFRLSCSVHVPLRTRIPTCPADQGLPGAVGTGGMARVRPVRTPLAASGVYRSEAPPGRKPRGASPPLLCLPADPAPEQASDFRHHAAHMLVLSVGQPMPAVGETQSGRVRCADQNEPEGKPP
jgi:hypothetical protein